jgi:hypothetical protein
MVQRIVIANRAGNAALAVLALAWAGLDGEAAVLAKVPGGAQDAGGSLEQPARVVTEIDPARAHRPPRFHSVAPRIAREGELYRYGFLASDPDGEELGYTLVRAPEGARLEGVMLDWTPSHTQAGRPQRFILRAVDEHGAVRDQAWSVIPRRGHPRGILAGPRTRH